jgi:hypothetical protein
MKMEMVDITKIKPANYNPRDITDEALEGLGVSVKKFDMVVPLVINTRTNTLVSGHQSLRIAEQQAMKKVPVVYVDLSLTEEKALNITLNSQAISGHFTNKLQELLQEIKLELNEVDYSGLKLDQLELKFDTNINDDENNGHGSLAERFGIPPFSVLNAREGWWQDRKRAWLALGIKSELGRGGGQPGT